MRTIKKRPPPRALVQWRAARLAQNRGPGMECTYEELRRDKHTLESVEEGLFAEQGGLCAYTGLGIGFEPGPPRDVGFHIEHVWPQAHCEYGEDTNYNNLVACYPRPNQAVGVPYGAVRKGAWPSTEEEERLFVSPLKQGCSERFSFNQRGEISPMDEKDDAAKKTIEKLGLDEEELTALRRNAIQGFLKPGKDYLGLLETRKLLDRLHAQTAALDRGDSVQLPAFSFVLQKVLPRVIKKLEGIKKSKQEARGSGRK